MSSTKEYLAYVLDQMDCIEGITYRAMMGEYILYCRGRIFGGIYDNRFLVKPTPSAQKLMPDAKYELPYEGAKQMLSVTDTDDRELLKKLVEAMYDELPEPKKGNKKARK